jgi:hypothetical protein
MANSTENVSHAPARPIFVPRYIENLNATARAHGLCVSAARIVREEVPQGGGVMKWEEHLAVDWRGTGAQLRSLGWMLPSWSFPVATVRGPGYKRLDTRWGVDGYVHVPLNEDEVIFAINHGDVPLRILASDGVETIALDWCTEYHGTEASLIGAGVADAQRLGGKRPRKTNGSYPDEPRWWRLLQPDGTIIFGIETDLAWSGRKKENERLEQSHRESQRSREASRFNSADEWKKHLEYLLDGVATAFQVVRDYLGKAPRFQLDPDSDAQIREIMRRSQAEIAEAFVAAKVIDTQRAKLLRLVVDNSP